MAKRLIRLFGFTVHDAPGEAEAECALLQQQGIVDAVLSEDVDTIMFGCTRTLRNWSSETRSNKTPTHVSVYDAAELRQSESGLGREGMVLVALMSGGDYIPEGIPGCGVKVACEAAKAGFGQSLCRIKVADKEALAKWKENLVHELRTNESGYFRTRHRALEIPESFPNMEVLRYYTHPVISQQPTLDKLKNAFPSTAPVDITGLREFSRDTFDWTFKIGAIKLIRVLAPSLLVRALVDRSEAGPVDSDDLDAVQKEESALVKAISGRRSHFSTDATPELRISYIPADIAKLDLDEEPEEVVAAYGRDGLALNSDNEFEEEAAEAGLGGGPSKTTVEKKTFDPSQPDLIWVPQSIVKLGVPLAAEDWEEQQRAKESRIAAKTSRKLRPRTNNDMPAGALDRWVKTSKPGKSTEKDGHPPPTIPSSLPSYQHTPPLSSARNHDAALSVPLSQLSLNSRAASSSTSSSARSKKPNKSKVPAAAARLPSAQTNPWTIAGSQVSPSVTKTAGPSPGKSSRQPIVIPSSPSAGPPSSPSIPRLRSEQLRSPAPRVRSDQEPSEPTVIPSAIHKETSLPAVGRPSVEKTTQRETRATRSRAQNGKAREDGAQSSIKNFLMLAKVTNSRASDKGTSHPELIELSEDEEDGSTPQRPVTEECGPKSAVPPPPVENDHQIDVPESTAESNKGKPVIVEDDTGDVDGANHWPAEGGSKKTRLYLPRVSDVGYFKEVEVAPEEAVRIEKEQGAAASGSRRIIRLSDVSVIDLTTYE